MNIGKYSYEEYIRLVESFHGSLAPGLLIGGFIIDLAMKNLPEGDFFDAICETQSCLPDAVQILTPCTIGNGWLKVFDFGKFAVTLYEKKSGNGVRVYLDAEKLINWPEINSWFFKLKPKKDQDKDLLLFQIKEAGQNILSRQNVLVDSKKLTRERGGPSGICPVCKEAYPVKHGDKCKNCSGESPYLKVYPRKDI
ncbi:formylmethanofuran dehydrogenase subunit E family protein [candidate division WOR-3 bacterium]|nr:formylmethanofuran dehydrogenase subunit E family protein [candidate division WOR-3 bacterium]